MLDLYHRTNSSRDTLPGGSTWFQPTPTPKRKRPPDNTSRLAACLATSAVWVSTAEGGPDDWKRAAEGWANSGVTHITLNNTFGRMHHKRIAENTLDAHLAAMEAYWQVVKDFSG